MAGNTASSQTHSGLGRLLRAAFSRDNLGAAPEDTQESTHEPSASTKTILFISPTGDFSNGAECSVFELMRVLAEAGHRVFNAYPAYSPSAEDDYCATLRATGVTPICIPELRWWPDAPGGDINTPPDAPADLAAITKIREIIRENAVDIVITNTVNIYHGALAAAAENAFHIWLIHEYPDGEFGYYRNKIKFMSDCSDALICVEGTLRESLMRLAGTRKIDTFLPYTNVRNTSVKQSASSRARIVCIGLMSERKNQLELLQAYALLPKDLKATELVFIGGSGSDGDAGSDGGGSSYQKRCEDFVARNSLENVSFVGYLENPWEYVCGRDIVVLPSKSETFGCVYAEALMYGVPVVASDNPGFATVKRLFGAGKLYPRGDAYALALAIKETLQNFEAEKAAAETSAQKVREAFTPQNAYAKVIAAIESMGTVKSSKNPRRKKCCDARALNELIVRRSEV